MTRTERKTPSLNSRGEESKEERRETNRGEVFPAASIAHGVKGRRCMRRKK